MAGWQRAPRGPAKRKIGMPEKKKGPQGRGSGPGGLLFLRGQGGAQTARRARQSPGEGQPATLAQADAHPRGLAFAGALAAGKRNKAAAGTGTDARSPPPRNATTAAARQQPFKPPAMIPPFLPRDAAAVDGAGAPILCRGIEGKPGARPGATATQEAPRGAPAGGRGHGRRGRRQRNARTPQNL